MSSRSVWRTQLAGWILFTVSAVLFTIDAIRNGATILTLASLAFLIACVLFLAPFVTNGVEQE